MNGGAILAPTPHLAPTSNVDTPTGDTTRSRMASEVYLWGPPLGISSSVVTHTHTPTHTETVAFFEAGPFLQPRPAFTIPRAPLSTPPQSRLWRSGTRSRGRPSCTTGPAAPIHQQSREASTTPHTRPRRDPPPSAWQGSWAERRRRCPTSRSRGSKRCCLGRCGSRRARTRPSPLAGAAAGRQTGPTRSRRSRRTGRRPW